MKRKTLFIAAVLAVALLGPVRPADAQCTALTLTANGSASVTVSPGSALVLAGMIRNCSSQPASVSVTISITHNGATVSTGTNTFRMQAGQDLLISSSFEVSKGSAGTYVATATSSNGGEASTTINVQ